MAAMNQKNMNTDNKWEACVKEYKLQLKAAEEWVKREQQGSKERVAKLEKDKIKKTPTSDRQGLCSYYRH